MKQSLKYWTTEDFEISSYKWSFKERPGKQFLGNGSDKGNNHYRFNEIGFRGDNTIFNGIKLMSVGCAHTEGIDVKDTETWCTHILIEENTTPTLVELNHFIQIRGDILMKKYQAE